MTRGRGLPRGRALLLLVLTSVACAAVHSSAGERDAEGWTAGEREAIRALSLAALGPMPPDPSNRWADDPAAVRLGRELYHETNLGADRVVTCASCHRGEYEFTDDLPLAEGLGTTDRRSMPLRAMAWQQWFFWDGRKDSMWSQALAPLEDPREHGISRVRVAQVVQRQYRRMYEEAFGPMPAVDFRALPAVARPAVDDARADAAWRGMAEAEREAVNQVFVHVGKSIAAFVRTFPPRPRAFDAYARAVAGGEGDPAGNAAAAGLARLDAEAKAGLKLFLGKAGCVDCHAGPLFTDHDFHAVGVADTGAPDRGRADGLHRLAEDEFHYFSRWSDADPARDPAPAPTASMQGAERAFKTPSLRGASLRPPYMHAGQYATLAEVLEHSRTPGLHGPAVGTARTSDDGTRLSDEELAALEAFLRTL